MTALQVEQMLFYCQNFIQFFGLFAFTPDLHDCGRESAGSLETLLAWVSRKTSAIRCSGISKKS